VALKVQRRGLEAQRPKELSLHLPAFRRPRVGFLAALALAACQSPGDSTALDSAAELAERVKQSLVVIEVGDRQGVEHPLGSGFVAGADGLIATSLHVIGEARPITVHLADGRSHPVVAVEALSREHDVALLRIDRTSLPALEVADSTKLRQGDPIVAFGNPHGMERTVVSGIVSALRTIDGTPMIQLAMPIEPGNSGGPVLDAAGRVHGIVTMKSRITENLGFAVRSEVLADLLAQRAPVPMKDWLTIGALDPNEWTSLFGALWRQRAGRIVVERAGQSFAGRSLCLYAERPEARPYTVGASVRLEDEDGAAGIALASDGGSVHYGFYPTRGRLRFTRFGGPDVMSWEILFDEKSDAYRPGEWNRLEVSRNERKLSCYVNGRLVFEVDDDVLPDGAVGLLKFRETRAEFKHFRLGRDPEAAPIARNRANAVRRLIAGEELDEAAKKKLLEDPSASLTMLHEEISRLQRRAEALDRVAMEIHVSATRDELVKELAKSEEQIDLFRTALLVAQLDNPELRIDDYVADLDRMARAITRRAPPIATESERIDILNRYLFAESGFHGGRDEYFHRSNSYLNEVIDDREGQPLALGILYMALGERLGLRMVAIGLPGHFLVEHIPRRGEPQLIDVFSDGQLVTEQRAMSIARHFGSKGLELAAPLPKARVIQRLLRNLREAARREGDLKGELRYLDTMLAIEPNLRDARIERAQLRLRSGPRENAQEDLDWLQQNAE
jgi:S1-C subfamily serine protease/regulator of sirC expression with transglutaminase-like and TPR domain